MLSTLENTMRRQTVLYAVQRNMFCNGCQTTLDVDRAFHVERKERQGYAILCSKCWANTGKHILKQDPDNLEQWEIWRGRDGAELEYRGKRWVAKKEATS